MLKSKKKGRVMRLFRLCSLAEIEAIKSNSADRIYFGSPLYRYINALSRYDINYYPTFDTMWEEYVQTGSLKPVVKTFKDIPKCIDISATKFADKQNIMYKFFYVDERPNMPRIVEDMMNNNIDDFAFVVSIKLSAFFDNPVKPYRFWKQAQSKVQNHIMEIEFDEKLATFYSGTGYYDIDLGNPYSIREYAIPLYMLKKDNIVDVYEFGSETDKQKRALWAENFCKAGNVDANLVLNTQIFKEKG